MDELGNEVVKSSLEIVLRPVAGVVDNAIGRWGGDYLEEVRKRHREKLRRKTEEILRSRSVDSPEHVSPSILLPLLEYAQDESRDELLELWAKLLAAAADPARARGYRREFVDIVRRLEPLDVLVLPILADGAELAPSRREVIASRLSARQDDVVLSFRNLHKLELTSPEEGINPRSQPYLLPLGRQLLALVSS